MKKLICAQVAAATLAGSAMAQVIQPTGLAPGSQYLIMFFSHDAIQATSPDIATYNTFAQQQASLNNALPDATWSAVVTAKDGAQANQASPTTDIPVYDTHGDLLEPNFPALFTDSSFAGPLYDQYGQKFKPNWFDGDYAGMQIWSGDDGGQFMGGGYDSNAPYTAIGFDGLSQIAGNGTPGLWLHGDDGPGWIYYCSTNTVLPLYAISSPITVTVSTPEPTPLALIGIGSLLCVCYLQRKKSTA